MKNRIYISEKSAIIIIRKTYIKSEETKSFSVLCSIINLTEGNRNIVMKFIDPRGKVLVDIDGTIPYELNRTSNMPEKYLGINISSSWQNVVFTESGIYKTVVAVDGEEAGVYEIYAKGKNEAG